MTTTVGAVDSVGPEAVAAEAGDSAVTPVVATPAGPLPGSKEPLHAFSLDDKLAEAADFVLQSLRPRGPLRVTRSGRARTPSGDRNSYRTRTR